MDIDEAIRILRTLPVSTVYESAGKLGDVAPSIRAMAPGMRLAGPAFTLKTMPGDNLSVFRAIHEAPAGSVLVIDGGDTERVTIWGGTSTTAAQAKGLAGCVTNASVRDLDEILESGFPVFAPGTSIRGTTKSHPGWIGVPVAIGGAIVRPGDIVLGDSDGVMVRAVERIDEVVPAALERRKKEQEKERRLRAGESVKSVQGF